MYCVMRASVPSLHNVYRRYDIYLQKLCIIGHRLQKRHSVWSCSEYILENQGHQLAIQRAIAWQFSCLLLSKPALQTHGVAKSMFGRK